MKLFFNMKEEALELSQLLKKQISMTEWFESIDHKDAPGMRKEDIEKRDRLAVLHELIDVPYEKPVRFPAIDVVNRSPDFLAFFENRKNELCALRLLPHDPAFPKLRNRGLSVRNVTETWLPKQDIDPHVYTASYMPHPSSHNWCSTFVVNENGIFGEIIADIHSKLTQGYFDDIKPISFFYDFEKWHLSEDNDKAKEELTEELSKIYVPNKKMQGILKKRLNATFSHDYLVGYFEVTSTDDFGIMFIDYNRILGDLYKDYTSDAFTKKETNSNTLKGQTGCPGSTTGRVRIVTEEDVHSTNLKPDEILVCDMTSPVYVPLMKQAAAIVTDRGGILTHAAIVSRELKKPCVVGVGNATEVLKDGMEVEVNASTGLIFLE